MTHLRKMMLEELERRNYAQTTKTATSRRSRTSRVTSSALPTSSVRSTSVSTRRICSASGNLPHIPLRNGWPGCAFSSSRR